MSEELDKMANSMFNNAVPDAWNKVGFLSLKPLASWMVDLLKRIKFLQDWIDGGTPVSYWVSGFFFPQAFFTGTKQNYARKHKIAIDELSFDFKILDDLEPQQFSTKPEDGCYCWGMYMEGARWDDQMHSIADSTPKQLFTEVPLVHFLPKRNRVQPDKGIYNCPVYKVLSRAGTLSTTGHSTNFCLWMELPSVDEERKWIVAGVAAFLALRY
jgi:dynein heavy chain, axonemal